MPPILQPDGRSHGVLIACQRPDDGRWLLVRRASVGPQPGAVSFPSGGVKQGESQEQTLVRKMKDELDVTAEPLYRFWRWDDGTPGATLTLFGWTARLQSFAVRPDATQVVEVLWLTLEEAARHSDALPTIPGFVAALDAFRDGQGPRNDRVKRPSEW